MPKKVILIKLGGSIITNKEIPGQLRPEVIDRLVHEIVRAKQQNPDTLFVLGHGQGSFAHVPASKYKTMDGFVNDESRLGMAIVQDNAAQLNRHIVHAFINAGVPAVSLYASNSIIAKKRKAHIAFTDVFEEYIRLGMLPVTGGDVIADVEQGCTIWSTEEVLSFFAQRFLDNGWDVQQILHVTEVEGVYDGDGQLIDRITSSTWTDVQKSLTATRGFDVTGGMHLKISESLTLAGVKITSKILSGLKKDNVYNALTNRPWVGTTIQ